jgi:hypothetical protein
VTTEIALANVDHGKVLQTLGLNVNDPKAQAVVLVCNRYSLDPLLKHVQLIKGNTYITRDGYLHIAHNSGVFDGMQVVDEVETPEYCEIKVAVWRKDMKYPFVAKGRCQAKNRAAGEAPAIDMALARAERRALRRAFDISGVVGTGDVDDDPDELYEDQVRNENRIAALSALSDAGIRDDVERHRVVIEATGGATNSTKNLSDEQVDMIRDSLAVRQDPAGGPESDPACIEGPPAGPPDDAPADDFTIIAMRNTVLKLSPEFQEMFSEAWKQHGFGSVRENAKRPLRSSQVNAAEQVLRNIEKLQTEAFSVRRTKALEAMKKAGVTTDEGQHALLVEATESEDVSIKALSSQQFDLLKRKCDEYADAGEDA